jgi:hypothetical protein
MPKKVLVAAEATGPDPNRARLFPTAWSFRPCRQVRYLPVMRYLPVRERRPSHCRFDRTKVIEPLAVRLDAFLMYRR